MINTFSRRKFIEQVFANSLVSSIPKVWAKPFFQDNPFTLGVASGYPEPSGVVLWTRLAPDPLSIGGGMPPEAVKVTYEISEDPSFRSIIDSGIAWSQPCYAHSVHVETTKLAPYQDYWYRFHVAGITSPIGHTRTAPLIIDTLRQMKFAFASCQNYEEGFYSAYRHMSNEDFDFIIHLGDYIYEVSWGGNTVRTHASPEPVNLEDYRQRYALYKLDIDLQAAHAAFPWMTIWDDHDVQDDYAADMSKSHEDPHLFLMRRAAAYQAWYEHMPARKFMAPHGAYARIYANVKYGRLAEINLLDDRQFRSLQPCQKNAQVASNYIENCDDRLNPYSTLLGKRQELWLADKLFNSRGRWNFFAQQTLMSEADSKLGTGQEFNIDTWDGYPAARDRFLHMLEKSRTTNPVVIGGDVHAYFIAELKRDFRKSNSPTIATEFCGTSITSLPFSEKKIADAKAKNLHIKYATGMYRGYTRMTVTPDILTTDLRVVDNHRDPQAKIKTLASFVVTDGKASIESN